MMFTVFLLGNAVTAFLAFLIYAAGLTHRAGAAQLLRGSQATQRASIILRDLEEPYHKLLEEGGFDNSFHYNRNLMPVLFDEARTIAKSSSDLPTLLLFGLFLATYGVIWLKTRIKANREDLRSLIGAEILLQRGSA